MPEAEQLPLSSSCDADDVVEVRSRIGLIDNLAALLGLESVSTGKLTDLRRHKTAWALLVIYIDLHESLMN